MLLGGNYCDCCGAHVKPVRGVNRRKGLLLLCRSCRLWFIYYVGLNYRFLMRFVDEC